MPQGFTDNLQAIFGLMASEQLVGMLNKPLLSVVLATDKESITFHFKDGSEQAFGVEGDCCSVSWIEHLTVPGNIEGAIVTNITENTMDATDDPEKNPERKPYYEGDVGREHESLQVYSTTFITDRGEIVLEYRNSSNGYYGGYLVAR